MVFSLSIVVDTSAAAGFEHVLDGQGGNTEVWVLVDDDQRLVHRKEVRAGLSRLPVLSDVNPALVLLWVEDGQGSLQLIRGRTDGPSELIAKTIDSHTTRSVRRRNAMM